MQQIYKDEVSSETNKPYIIKACAQKRTCAYVCSWGVCSHTQLYHLARFPCSPSAFKVHH